MPHLILERSANVPDHPDLPELLAALHAALLATGEFREADIKSRVITHDLFRVGDGAPDRAFVALEAQVMDGRSDETKKRIADALWEVLAKGFPLAVASGRSSVTVQVCDIHRASYRRAKVE